MGEGRASRLSSRLRLVRLVALVAFGVLVLRLWHIQFVQGAALREQARANRFAQREIPADRGVIYDREGRQVVVNRPQFTLSIVPAALPEDARERARVLARVAAALDMPLDAAAAARVPELAPADGAADAVPGASGRPTLVGFLPYNDSGELIRTWSSVPIPRALGRQVAFDLMEEALDLPGVIVGESSVREYRTGPTLGHVLGFTGSIPEDELADYRAKNYQIYDVVGRTGLEYVYESQLRGEKGEKIVQVDAGGREVGDTATTEALPASPGNSLHLTLDAKFQDQTEAALRRALAKIGARSGAVAAIDPRDGAVRALVSLPNYDNNMFATGASPEDWAALLANPDRPLIDRTIAGQYAPGSVFKLITASAALQEGVVTAATRISDPGIIYYPNQYDPAITYPFYCWNTGGHGSLNVVGALAQSCDVFFYEVSGGNVPGRPEIRGLGSERLARYAEFFGLGAPTQIDLLGEASGRVPTSAWFEEWSGEFWGTGKTYIMGIGQGYTMTTPLQMANVTAAVANGGTLYRPHLVEDVRDAEGRRVPVTLPDGTTADKPGGVIRQLPVAPEHLARVREGMLGAVRSGTAQAAWTHLPVEIGVAGKTGTAEFCDPVEIEGQGDCRRDKDGHLLTHAWFVAFAPAENPELAVAVFVDGSGMDRLIEGSREAAPIAAEVLRAYFKLPERRPTTPPTVPSTAQPDQGADGATSIPPTPDQ
jgi:penicillin-binding protein 2